MTKVEDLEKAVASLPPRELVQFRAWFEVFDAGQFDAKIEGDAASGMLDALADEALTEFRGGRARRM